MAAKTGIILPLYKYLTGDVTTADWNGAIAAATAYPDVDFYVIVNDNSGSPYTPNPPDAIKDFASFLGAWTSTGTRATRPRPGSRPSRPRCSTGSARTRRGSPSRPSSCTTSTTRWSPYEPASEDTLRTDIAAMVAKGLHSLYVAQLGYNANFTGAEPASVTTVARLVAAA
ncbi:hypothetical protein Hte_002966 [Hypoxylon texense]